MKHTSFPLLILFLLGLLPSFLWGQNRRGEEDVVYLHNGSVIRGHIVEQEIGRYVKIKVASEQVFTVLTAEIDRITIEPPLYTQIQLVKYKYLQPITYPQKGLYHVVDWGLNFYQGQWGPIPSTALHYRAIYHQNRFLRYGLGTGWDIYSEGTITPFFAELQGDLLEKPITPTWLLQGGYGIGVTRDALHDVFDGGLMGQAALGLKFHTRSRTEISVTMGYRFQQTYQEFREWPQDWWNVPPGVIQDPVTVIGTRRYQRIHFQLSITL